LAARAPTYRYRSTSRAGGAVIADSVRRVRVIHECGRSRRFDQRSWPAAGDHRRASALRRRGTAPSGSPVGFRPSWRPVRAATLPTATCRRSIRG